MFDELRQQADFVRRVVRAIILELQPISRESPNNVAHPLRLLSTLALITYSFVLHHQHGYCARMPSRAEFCVETSGGHVEGHGP